MSNNNTDYTVIEVKPEKDPCWRCYIVEPAATITGHTQCCGRVFYNAQFLEPHFAQNLRRECKNSAFLPTRGIEVLALCNISNQYWKSTSLESFPKKYGKMWPIIVHFRPPVHNTGSLIPYQFLFSNMAGVQFFNFMAPMVLAGQPKML